MTSSWFFLSTLNYDARSATHQIYKFCFTLALFAVPRLSAGLPFPQRNCWQAGATDSTSHTHPRRRSGQAERSLGEMASTPDHRPRQPSGVRGDEAPGWHVIQLAPDNTSTFVRDSTTQVFKNAKNSCTVCPLFFAYCLVTAT